MAASLSLRVYTGAGATESAAQTGIDLISADNATNSLANRQANPITVGTNSYEKYVKLKIDTAPANAVDNFQIWMDGAVDSSTTLNFTTNYITYATPVATASTVAQTNMTTYTSGNKVTWDNGPYTFTNDTTRFTVFQLVVDSDAGPGNWTQETISYSYDET
jgi:hypothetical protein